MMVEAKKLDTSLRNEKVLTQGLAYCQRQGTRYLSVTDGRRWEIYETHKLAGIDEKRIVEFDLKSQSTAEACLKALTLWQLKISGDLAPGQTPIITPTHNQPDSQEPPPPSPDERKWQLLSKLNPQRGAPSPVEIQFPDNSVVSVTTWRSLLVKIATWLINNNHLTKSHCPIRRSTRSKKYIVHTEPVHEDGSQFYAPPPIESLYIHRFGSPWGNTRAWRSEGIDLISPPRARFDPS